MTRNIDKIKELYIKKISNKKFEDYKNNYYNKEQDNYSSNYIKYWASFKTCSIIINFTCFHYYLLSILLLTMILAIAIVKIQANITNATDAPTPILLGPPAENE